MMDPYFYLDGLPPRLFPTGKNIFLFGSGNRLINPISNTFPPLTDFSSMPLPLETGVEQVLDTLFNIGLPCDAQRGNKPLLPQLTRMIPDNESIVSHTYIDIKRKAPEIMKFTNRTGDERTVRMLQ